MSLNKMSTRNSRIPRENLNQRQNLKNVGDSLAFVQEVIKENKALKARIEVLELQQSQCEAFHAEAKLANETLQLVHKENLKKADDIIEKMAEDHSHKLMQFVTQQIEKERRMSGDINELKSVIDKLKTNLKEKDEIILENSNQGLQIQGLTKDLRSSANEVMLLKLSLGRFQEYKNKSNTTNVNAANVNVAKQLEQVKEEKARLADDNSQLQQTKLEMQLRIVNLEKQLTAKCQEENSLDAMRAKFEKACRESAALAKKDKEQGVLIGNVEEDNKKLTKEVEALSSKLEDFETERIEMDRECARMKEEMETYKGQSEKRRKESVNFRDFVGLKREVQSLKQWNCQLKEKLQCNGSSDAKRVSGMFMVIKDPSAISDHSRPPSRPPSRSLSRQSSAASRQSRNRSPFWVP